MHENAPFLTTKFKKFLGRGTALYPYPIPTGEGIPLL